MPLHQTACKVAAKYADTLRDSGLAKFRLLLVTFGMLGQSPG